MMRDTSMTIDTHMAYANVREASRSLNATRDEKMTVVRKTLFEAVARYRGANPGRVIEAGPLPYGHETGEIAPPMNRTVNIVLKGALKKWNPEFHIGLDYAVDDQDQDDRLPQALLLSRPDEHFHAVVPITWTTGTVTVGPGRNGYERTIIRNAPNAGDRLVDALALIAAVYLSPAIDLSAPEAPLKPSETLSQGRGRRF